jgi:secreted protein with Ig-like and vWFA domain
MNDQNLSLTPDDPRLTAFALGELEGPERDQVAAAITANPALQSVVDEIRATASQLESALAAEPVPAARPDSALSARNAAIIPGNDLRKLDGGSRRPMGQVIPFSRYLTIAGGLAAAGFAVLVAINPERGTPPRPAVEDAKKLTMQRELKLATAAEAASSQRQAADAQAAAEQVRSALNQAAAPKVASVPTMTAPVPTAEGAKVESATLTGPAAAQFRISEPAAVPVPTPSAAPAPREQVVQLMPFNVSADPAGAFQANAVGTGARVATEIKDSTAAYSATNRAFIDALGIADISEAATWVAGQSFQTTQLADSNQQFQTRGLTVSTGGLAAAGGRGGGGGRGGRGAPPAPPPNTESYGLRRNNTFVSVADAPLSTFSIDVDSAAYANVRRFLQNGQLPPVEAVRVEEMVNYFPYRYAAPEPGPARPIAAAFGLAPRGEPAPFAASLEVATAPWDSSVRLVRVGLKGREVSTADRPRANLVFLLDVSGSMNQPNKLPLVKESMRLLLRRLREDDRVAIVVYAGATGVALPSTAAANGGAIEAAIERLTASGSTNGAAGINLAYQIANENFVRGGINRVILCTDGDFNVGVTNQGDLVRMVEERAKSNVFLTVLGFGMGNLKDSTLELLADKGNGNYGYIDTRAEAEKLLVDQVNGTLVTIAKDVKIQVEFNPARVAAYRLVGYENRLLAKEDFNNDRVDAGEIGAGHTVTALYEVVPAAGANVPAEFGVPPVDELKYQRPAANATPGQLDARFGAAAQDSDELLTVKIRYKEPTGTESRKLEFPLHDTGKAFSAASPDFKFAAAVAGFGLALREDRPNVQVMNAALEWADDGLRDDPMGYRSEFIGLVRRAASLVASGARR